MSLPKTGYCMGCHQKKFITVIKTVFKTTKTFCSQECWQAFSKREFDK